MFSNVPSLRCAHLRAPFTHVVNEVAASRSMLWKTVIAAVSASESSGWKKSMKRMSAASPAL